jgi:hypothetical protein
MNNEHFDRILHSKLAEHQVAPPPEVWNAIEKQNTNRKRFLWLGALLVTILSSGLYLIFSGDETSRNHFSVQNNEKNYNTASATYTPIKTEHPVNQQQSLSSKPLEPSQNLPDNPVSVNTHGVYPANVNTVSFSENLQVFDGDVSEVFPVSFLSLYQLGTYESLQPAEAIVTRPFSVNSITRNLSFVMKAGPLFATKHLQSKYHLKNDDKYIRYRNESEMRNSAWSASLLMQLDLSKNFFIRTGLNMTSISERIGMRYLKALVNGVATDTIVGTRNDFTDPAQLLSATEDQNFKLLEDYSLFDKARYRFISFPLMAGIIFDQKKFSWYASGGLALNFSSAYQGKILAPDSAYLLSIEDVSVSPFNKLTGFTIQASAGIGYRVTQKIKILIEPNYFLQLPDFTRSNYRLSQRFSGYGIQTGIIYKL